MSSKEFQFPILEGTEMILTELPKKLKYGIYKIKFDINTITDNFNVVFKYSNASWCNASPGDGSLRPPAIVIFEFIKLSNDSVNKKSLLEGIVDILNIYIIYNFLF